VRNAAIQPSDLTLYFFLFILQLDACANNRLQK
jgi:hypothetical protein